MDASRILGSNVRRLRDAQKMTQTDLAERSGKSRNYLASLETGRIEEPGASTLYDIANALDTTMETLMGRPPLPVSDGVLTLPEAQAELTRRLDVIGVAPFQEMNPDQFAAFMPDAGVTRAGIMEAAALATHDHLDGARELPFEYVARSFYGAGACAMALVAHKCLK